MGRRTSAAIACTAWKSPGELAANPASIMSTPSRSSCLGNLHLLRRGQADARGLLAVSQGGVEYHHFVVWHYLSPWLSGTGSGSLSGGRCSKGNAVRQARGVPGAMADYVCCLRSVHLVFFFRASPRPSGTTSFPGALCRSPRSGARRSPGADG